MFFFSFGCKCTCAKDTMTLSLDLLELLKHQSLKINPVANGRPIRKQNSENWMCFYGQFETNLEN